MNVYRYIMTEQLLLSLLAAWAAPCAVYVVVESYRGAEPDPRLAALLAVIGPLGVLGLALLVFLPRWLGASLRARVERRRRAARLGRVTHDTTLELALLRRAAGLPDRLGASAEMEWALSGPVTLPEAPTVVAPDLSARAANDGEYEVLWRYGDAPLRGSFRGGGR